MKTIWKVLIALGIIILLIAATYSLWMPRLAIVYTRFEFGSKPGIANTPEPHILASEGLLPSIYRIGDIQFQTPWAGTPAERGDGANVIALNFPSVDSNTGPAVAIFNNAASLLPIAQLAGTLSQLDPTISISSSYELYGHIYDATPKTLDVMGSLSKSMPAAIELPLKYAFRKGDGTIYSFQSARGLKGYEFVNATSTVFDLFSSSNIPYMVVVTNATQQDAESIVNSAW